MANKSTKKNNKNIIIGICIAVVVLIAIIIAIILGTRNGGFGGLNDSYFKSDGSKYVLTIETDTVQSEEEHAPLKTHLVYTYAGDKITGLKVYYEYANKEDAEASYKYYNENAAEEYKSISHDGKYVILEVNESGYEGVTPEDVKQQIEFMEMLKDLEDENITEDTDAAVEEPSVVEETEVVEEVQE